MISSAHLPQRGEKCAEILLVAVTVGLAAVLARPYAGGWNDGSRLATVESLVDQHSWIIDQSVFVQVPRSSPASSSGTGEEPNMSPPLPYSPRDPALLEHGTQDKLFIDGHFYSDKSPVPAVLMAGCYQLWQWTTGQTARTHPDRFCRAMTVASSGMAYVVAVWCLFHLGQQLGLPLTSQLLLSISFAFSTVALPYARQVNNHILLLAVTAALALEAARLCDEARSNRIGRQRFVRLGFFSGLGYTIDLGAGPVILLCTTGLVWTYLKKKCLKPFFVFLLAALPWLVLHHALNYAISGSFRPANTHPEYFRWPGSPFSVENLTGNWIHPNLGIFLLYAASMLVGKRGFFGHNLPLFLTLPALFLLLRRSRGVKREVWWALGCCVGTWLLYAATSNNSSGQCCTIRWFVPLLAPAYFILALLLRYFPSCRLDLLILSVWGMLLVVLMREGPWKGGMVPFFWPIQVAALASWGLCFYLRRRALVGVMQHSYTNVPGHLSPQEEERSGLWITTPSSFGAHASTTSATLTSTCRATNSSSSPV